MFLYNILSAYNKITHVEYYSDAKQNAEMQNVISLYFFFQKMVKTQTYPSSNSILWLPTSHANAIARPN